jgi:hypothetical protein
MSLFIGMALIGISVLSLRWLKHWYARHERTGSFADAVVVNFVLPSIAATLMSGAIAIVIVLLDGITLVDAAAAALLAGLIVVAWRRMGREKHPDNVVPLTPKPGVTSAPHPKPLKAPRRAA